MNVCSNNNNIENQQLNLNIQQDFIEQQIRIIEIPISQKESIELSNDAVDEIQKQNQQNNLKVMLSYDEQDDLQQIFDPKNPQLQINSAQPRRRSLFGQQHDLEIKENINNKKGQSKKKDTISSTGSQKFGKKKTQKDGDKNNDQSQIRKLIMVNKPEGNQIVKESSQNNIKNNQQNQSSQIQKNENIQSNSVQEIGNISMSTSKQVNQTSHSLKANPYEEFTLEDLKLLQETIQINRHELEKELIDIQQQKKFKRQITLQPRIAKKWEKVKNQLMAFTVMRKIFSDIKKYGTSMQALSISDQVIEKCRDLLEKRQIENMPRKKLIYHDSLFFIIWQSIMFFLYCFTGIFCPYKIFFKEHNQTLYQNLDDLLLDKVIEFLFFIDILVKINTVIQNQNGLLIESRKEIFINYLKKGLIFDILQILPFEVLGQIYPVLDTYIIQTSFYDEVIRIIRIPFLMNSVTIDQKILDYFKVQSTIQRLIRFSFAVGFSVHIVGCLWVFIARVQYDDYNNWIKRQLNYMNNNVDIHDSTKVYLFAIYWCLQTLATVGFGDIHASNEGILKFSLHSISTLLLLQNKWRIHFKQIIFASLNRLLNKQLCFENLFFYFKAEIIFSLFWMVVGVGFYSFAIGQLSKMFTDSESRQSKLTNSIYIMDEFCAQAMLPSHINDKIRNALQYSTNKSILSSTEKEDFFDSIPTKLKTSLAVGMFKGMITAVPFLKNKDNIFLANLLPMLQPLKLSKGDFIYKKDSYPNLVYFIIDGKVNFLIGPNEMVFKSFLAGSYFGEIEIFHQCLRLFSVRCEESCELLTLDRDYFGELMDKFPQVESEMFEMVQKRQELMNDSLQKIDLLLELNENDNFWRNRETRTFADIIMRRRTQSGINQEEDNRGENYQNVGSNHLFIASNNQLMSSILSSPHILDNEKQLQVQDNSKDLKINQNQYKGNTTQANSIIQNQIQNIQNGNYADSQTSIKFFNPNQTVASIGDKSQQQNISMTSFGILEQQQQQLQNTNQKQSKGYPQNNIVDSNDEKTKSRNLAILKKTSEYPQIQQQSSVNSNSSSNNNINSVKDPLSMTNIPQQGSVLSFKNNNNNNIVLNVFNERQEHMLVEVYEEEIQQTKEGGNQIQDETKQNKTLSSSPVSSLKNFNLGENQNLKVKENKRNVNRIQQKYGVSSLDRIEEKYSHFDIENLSNSQVTNDQLPSFNSLKLQQKKNKEENNKKQSNQSSSDSSLSSQNENNNQPRQSLNNNDIKLLQGLSPNIQNGSQNQLELSVGSIKNLGRSSTKKKKEIIINPQDQKQDLKEKIDKNEMENINIFKVNHKKSQSKNLNQMPTLKLKFKSDSLQENAQKMDEIIRGDHQSYNSTDKNNSSIEKIRKSILLNQNIENFSNSQQIQDKNINNSLSSPEYLMSFGSKKNSESYDSPTSQYLSFSEALQKRIKNQMFDSVKSDKDMIHDDYNMINNAQNNITNTQSNRTSIHLDKNITNKEKYNINDGKKNINKDKYQENNDKNITKDNKNNKISNPDSNQNKNHSNNVQTDKKHHQQIYNVQQHHKINEGVIKKQQTLNLNEDHQNTQDKHISLSDRLDRVYNKNRQLKIIVPQNDAVSLNSSKNKSLQDINMIDTSPEQSPVIKLSRLSFQTRGSRQSIFNQQSDFINENLNQNNDGQKRNNFQRYQKTQTNFNSESDEERMRSKNRKRKTKTMNNIREIKNDTLDIQQEKNNNSQDKSKDFDIQSLRYLAKNGYASPPSEICSPINMKHPKSRIQFLLNGAESLKEDKFNLADLSDKENKIKFPQKQKKEQNQDKKKRQDLSKSKKSKKKIKESEEIIYSSNAEIKEEKQSKKKIKNGRTQLNITSKSEDKKTKKKQKEKPKEEITALEKKKNHKSQDRQKSNHQKTNNDLLPSPSKMKSKITGNQKGKLIFDFLNDQDHINEDQTNTIENPTQNLIGSPHKIKGQNSYNKIDSPSIKLINSSKKIQEGSSKKIEGSQNKLRSSGSFMIQDMIKPIENDLQEANEKKTITLFRKLTQRRDDEFYDVKDNIEEQSDAASSDSDTQKKEYFDQNDEQNNITNQEMLSSIREQRKKNRSQTNMFEDRIKLLKRMESIQGNNIGNNSPVRHKLQHSNSIFSPSTPTQLQNQKSIDFRMKELNFSEVIEEEKPKHKISFKRGESNVCSEINSPKSFDLQLQPKSNKKRDNQSTHKHKSKIKNSEDKQIYSTQKSKKNIQMKQKQKEMADQLENLKRIKKTHQKEITQVKSNVFDISNKLDSLTYQYDNIKNLVTGLTQEIQQMQKQDESPQNKFFRQIANLPFPIIKKEINKSALSIKEMEELDHILSDLDFLSPKAINPLLMRQKNNSSDSSQSQDKTKRLLLNLGKIKTEDNEQEYEQ